MTKRPEGIPKTIKIARQRHYCAKCGAVIEIGDKMTMHIGGGYGRFVLCLKCDGRYPEWLKAEGQDNHIGED